jgi:hypothetical protein
MATYPAALPSIPDDGTWNHAQVAREVEAIATELGTNPRGSQTNVAGRFTAVEGRVTAVEGATSVAGVEVASAQLTTDYNILGQTSNTTWTDIGLSIAVGAQTRAYNLIVSCSFVAVTSGTFAPTKAVYPALRIVDSGVTVVAETSQFPIIMVSASVTYITKGYLLGRIPAGQAATTWKVQARNGISTPDAQVTSLAVYAGTALATPGGGVTRNPCQLSAITV